MTADSELVNPAIPAHVGYIVDGNRRWAKQRGLPSIEGHKAGLETVKKIIKKTFDAGAKFVTCFIFSTENWDRAAEEVNYLMKLFEAYFDKETKKLHKENIKVAFLGNRTQKVSKKLVKLMEEGEELTKNNTRGTLGLCFNYGGRLEIADACQKIVRSGVKPEEITPELIEQNLYHPDIPQLDIMIRTSGEQRISNFMLWRVAYSELMWIDKNFPDMTEDDVDAIFKEYGKRHRRFGK